MSGRFLQPVFALFLLESASTPEAVTPSVDLPPRARGSEMTDDESIVSLYSDPSLKIVSRATAKSVCAELYFTGDPCPGGHLSQRLVSTTHCIECDPHPLNQHLRFHGRRKALGVNPEAARTAGRNRRARKRLASGKHTAADIKDLYALQKGRCGNCRCSLKAGFHVDHKIALANGGTNDRSNIELLCPPCNLRKHAKDPIVWARENGRLL